jgi:phytoene synthase
MCAAERPAAVTGAEVVLAGLEEAAARLRVQGVPVPVLEGKLLRPLLAYALVPPALRGRVDRHFWAGALAVQMVHEASLLHDDILDGAAQRRGRATVVAGHGVGTALVLGDHYLTGAYRAAAEAASTDFLACFIRAVERTVAGEVAQGRAAGRPLSDAEYRDVVTGKSGELIGAATCLGGAVFRLGGHAERVSVGRDLGTLYQQVDDLLDYCPAADTGKPPFQDYRHGKWTWMLPVAGVHDFSVSEDEVLRRLFSAGAEGASPARQAVARLERDGAAVLERVARLSPGDELAREIVEGWVATAERAVASQEAAARTPLATVGTSAQAEADHEADVASLASSVGGPEAWPRYFGRHARTFRFAARLFPPAQAARIAGLYAYCRFTDDLVDHPADRAPADVLERRLDVWADLSRRAYQGHTTGIPLLDVVMAEAGSAGVSWRYPDALLGGIGMDLTRTRYPDWASLEEYTFGVAGAVGGWVTQLFGIHDEELLHLAHALGHGMQLTNIARDVGEDLDMDRVYLPLDLLEGHGLTPGDLHALRSSSAPVPAAYRDLTEAVLARAESYYGQAWAGIRALPSWYRRPVAVAAQAYAGIHREIRRNGYDNLRRRAATSGPRKTALAAAGLWKSLG